MDRPVSYYNTTHLSRQHSSPGLVVTVFIIDHDHTVAADRYTTSVVP